MNYLTLEQFKKGLERNEEYEFIYLSNTYSVSCNKDGWYLTKYSDWENYQTYASGLELLEKAKIDGKHIVEIFDDLQF